jgi:putative endonuclease
MSRNEVGAYFVCVMASAPRGTLYIGVTNDLIRRAYERREGITSGFTKRYGVKRLVYFEAFDDPTSAVTREKTLKRWNRSWKIDLVETSDPLWNDLYIDLTAPAMDARVKPEHDG